MSEQQILRLLATIREEVAGIRSRQEELYELLISYKDQIHEVKRTVESGLEGLPTSPYIAGQLVPAPHQVEGVDEFTQMLSTYLHKGLPAPPPPRDTTYDPPQAVEEGEIQLEAGENKGRRSGGRRSGGGGGGGGPRDTDLMRGPDRDVTQIDLDEGDDEEGGKKKKRRRRRRRRKSGSEAGAGE